MRVRLHAWLILLVLFAGGLGAPLASAHPVFYLLEAEAFPTRTGGSTQADAAASNGATWSTSTTASISSSWFAEHEGRYRVVVRARGVAADGIQADMTVFIDARAVGHWRATNDLAPYVVDEAVLTGTHAVRILFATPGSGAGGARTLVVDTVQIELIGNGDPVSSWTEVESLATLTTGGVFSDVAASAGKAWNLWSNGYARATVTVATPTTFRTSIWARGDLPGDVPAAMALRIDGEMVATYDVTSAKLWEEHVANVSVGAGTHTFDIMFTNDANGPAGDRNLRVDALRLLPLTGAPPPPAPQQRYEIESFPSLASGGVQRDATASAGKIWNQWSNGVASMTLTLESAESIQFAIRARGSVMDDAWPLMGLRIDGITLQSWEVMGGNYAVYTASADLGVGAHTIGIAFTNDARSATQDRNLYLDHIETSAGSAAGSATPPPPTGTLDRFEAETFPTRASGGVQSDASASGGKVWNQWTNGAASMPLSLGSAQSLLLTIRARGSPSGGTWPLMDLRIDDAVVGQWNVATRTLASFSMARNVSSGPHVFAIGFTNDARSETEDRNLYVDLLEVLILGPAGEVPPPPAGPGAITPPVAGASQWRQGGYDLNGSHFNANEATLGASNAGSLRQVWDFPTKRSAFSTPAVVDGKLYFGDTGGIAYALNASTGAQIWKNADATGNIANSMAVADGRVFHGRSGGELLARDASTGAILWRTRLDTIAGSFIWSSPVYHAGKLYVGVASSQEAAGRTGIPDFRGSFVRVDAVNGTIDWRYYIVPPGYTGGAMWSTAALDTETRIVYFGTGNAYTAPAHARTDAIIALDADTGALKWSTQGYANDVWTATNPEGPDTDFAMPVMLWTDANGQKLVGAGNKVGDFFALDPQTGAVIWRVHPQKTGQGFFGPGASAYGRIFAGLGGNKEVIAMDASTGRVLWRAPVSAGFTAGVTVANGAVFAATQDGVVWAFDAATGAQLWSAKVPGGSLGIVLGTPSVAEGKLFVPYVQTSYGSGPGGVVAFSV